jgi:hypothetical protein
MVQPVGEKLTEISRILAKRIGSNVGFGDGNV